MIILKFLIYRTCPSYILTIFLPSALITFLGTITLSHFRVNDFLTRITVTVSILIVISTLYSQITSTIPTSPEIKMLELYFLYCIVRLSIVYFKHAAGQTKANNKKKISPYISSASIHHEKVPLASIPGRTATVFVPNSGIRPIDNRTRERKYICHKKIFLVGGYLLDILVIIALASYVTFLRSQKLHEYEGSNFKF